VLAIDLCDLDYGQVRTGEENVGRFARDITTLVPDGQGAVTGVRRA
jgi:hypothetical protein